MREGLIEVEIPNTLDERVVDAASDCRGSLMASAAWSLLGRLVSGVHPGVQRELCPQLVQLNDELTCSRYACEIPRMTGSFCPCSLSDVRELVNISRVGACGGGGALPGPGGGQHGDAWPCDGLA